LHRRDCARTFSSFGMVVVDCASCILTPSTGRLRNPASIARRGSGRRPTADCPGSSAGSDLSGRGQSSAALPPSAISSANRCGTPSDTSAKPSPALPPGPNERGRARTGPNQPERHGRRRAIATAVVHTSRQRWAGGAGADSRPQVAYGTWTDQRRSWRKPKGQKTSLVMMRRFDLSRPIPDRMKFSERTTQASGQMMRWFCLIAWIRPDKIFGNDRLATNVPSRWRIASITSNDAMILPHCANAARMRFSRTTGRAAPNTLWV